MNIIHVVKTQPRVDDDALAARRREMRAVVRTGARQIGKSTPVEKLVPGKRRYRSLDDFDVSDAARRDPEAPLSGNDPRSLDEVPREPDLLPAVKRVFDRVELADRRTTISKEVLVVIEAGGKLLPIEAKATAKPRLADCAHLRTFRQEYGRKARAGLLLHTGRTVEWLTPDVLAVPWWRVL